MRSLALSLFLVVVATDIGAAQQKSPPRRRTPLCVTPSPTVVGWWPFDEAVGSTTADDIANSSLYGPYGIQQNAATYAPPNASPTPGPGMVANALSFDGNDYRFSRRICG